MCWAASMIIQMELKQAQAYFLCHQERASKSNGVEGRVVLTDMKTYKERLL